MEPETEPSRQAWLSDALLIAAAPACLYALTLAYHLSFAYAFDVPFQVISVTWTDVFIAIFVLGGIAFFAALFSFLVSCFWSKSTTRVGYQLAMILLAGVVSLAQSVYFIVVHRHWTGVLMFLAGMVSGGLSSRLIHREHVKHIALDPAGASKWSSATIGLLWVYLGVSTALIAGDAQAKYQKEFYVVEGSSETVVLGIWGDTVVTAPFDRSRGVVKRDFTIAKITDHSPLEIRMERIGPLRTEDPSAK